MLQMVKFTTGETCVIDRERGLRSAWLDWGDDDAPLTNYSLDHDLDNLLASGYRVLRDAWPLGPPRQSHTDRLP